MNVNFTALIDFMRQAQRDISTRKIAQFGKLNRNQLSQAKKQLGIQFKPVSELVERGQERTLILDYVLIHQKMEIIDRPYNWVYNPTTRKVEPCKIYLSFSQEPQTFFWRGF